MSTAAGEPASELAAGAPAHPAPDLLDQVRREIDQEARRLRASGAFPPSFERRLEDLFAQVVPTGVVAQETAEALRHLESVSHVDVEVPTASNLPGGSAAKQLLRRMMAWYLEYLASQLNRFMASTVRVLRVLDERVAALEAEVPLVGPLGGPPAERSLGVDLGAWAELVIARLSGSGDAVPGTAGAASGSQCRPGLVLHAECGTGELLKALSADGIDAYGIDPRADLLDQAVLTLTVQREPALGPPGSGPDLPGAPPGAPGAPPGAPGSGPDLAGAPGARVGLDVRWADPVDHLRGLDDDALGGVVLSGCVDRLEVGAQRALAALAAVKVAPGGVVVVIGSTPSAWLARRVGLDEVGMGLVEADLAPGRPLHPQTWAWMLESEGLANVEVVLGASPFSPPISGPGASGGDEAPTVQADEELTRIAAMLRGPASFAVVATRPAARPWP